MTRLITIIICVLTISNGIAQEKKDLDPEKIIASSANVACECIDSISTIKSQEEKVIDVSTCIKRQLLSFQLMSKLLSAIDLKDSSAIDGKKKEINVSIDSDENSDEYKKYYYELERYLMKTCPALKAKMATQDKPSEKSISYNKTALSFYNKGLKQSAKDNYAKAIKYYKSAVNEDPEFAFAWDNLGLAYRKLNNYDKAIEAYEKSLKIDPNGINPLQNLAVAYQYKKEYTQAIQIYQRLAEEDENNPEVYYGIGLIYSENLKNYEEGLRNLCKAYNLYIEQKSPYRTDAENLIAAIYTKMKEDGKEDIFNQILEENHISIEK